MTDPKREPTPGPSPPVPVADTAVQPVAPGSLLGHEPSPEVQAIFLRTRPAPTAVATQESRTTGAAGLDESLIDSLTRIITDLLRPQVRESVTAAVRALAPHLVVSLPADAGTGDDAQLRTRPSRLRRHD